MSLRWATHTTPARLITAVEWRHGLILKKRELNQVEISVVDGVTARWRLRNSFLWFHLFSCCWFESKNLIVVVVVVLAMVENGRRPRRDSGRARGLGGHSRCRHRPRETRKEIQHAGRNRRTFGNRRSSSSGSDQSPGISSIDLTYNSSYLHKPIHQIKMNDNRLDHVTDR